jgi:HEXXH motif-containing protein
VRSSRSISRRPPCAGEALDAVSVIVPVISARGGRVRTSSSTAFVVGLLEPPDLYWSAVTLVHEIQHLKLLALLASS